jgi:hypothetical protein
VLRCVWCTCPAAVDLCQCALPHQSPTLELNRDAVDGQFTDRRRYVCDFASEICYRAHLLNSYVLFARPRIIHGVGRRLIVRCIFS